MGNQFCRTGLRFAVLLGAVALFGGAFAVRQAESGTGQGQGYVPLGQGLRYEGEIRDGRIHGDGMIVFPDGTRLLGVFRDAGEGRVLVLDGELVPGRGEGSPGGAVGGAAAGAAAADAVSSAEPNPWMDRIASGKEFFVVFDRTGDKFDDAAFTGDWRTDPMGSLKGGETYRMVYKDGLFTCTGYDQQAGREYTKTKGNVNLKDSMISMWGRGYHFDREGRVYDRKYGLVGHLRATGAVSGGGSGTGGAALDKAAAMAGVWEFGRGDGSVIARDIRLMPDGRIQGYSHPNEASWAWEDGMVVFYNNQGTPSTRFDTVSDRDGRLVLSGKLVRGGGTVHELRLKGGIPAKPGAAGEGTYLIRPEHSGKCVGFEGGRAAEGALAEQQECGGSAQEFALTAFPWGEYQLADPSGRLCLTLESDASRSVPLLRPCDGRRMQMFALRDKGGGVAVFEAVETGKCLDVSGKSTSAGAPVQIWPCHENANQRFKLDKAR